MALNINGTTGISGVDGSASAPALTGTDSNTGITFPSADTIKFATGGVERFAISNSGLSGDGSGLTGIQAGITMADRWHLASNFNISSANTLYQINTGWAKSTSAGYNSGSLGSAMTESSGVFTFPSTGIYYIVYDCITGTSNDQLNMWSYIAVGADGTATDYLSVKASSGDSGTMNTVTGSAMLDVTDTSTQKINVKAYFNNTGGYVSSNSNGQRTVITFIRLGDT